MKMNFLTEYDDFREVEGVILHHKENKFAGSVNTARLELRSVTLNAKIADVEFSPHADDDSKNTPSSRESTGDELIST